MTKLHAREFKCNDIGTTLQIQVSQGYVSTSKGGGWSLIAPIFQTGVAKFIVQISVSTMNKGNIGILLMSLKVPTASDRAHCTLYRLQGLKLLLYPYHTIYVAFCPDAISNC